MCFLLNVNSFFYQSGCTYRFSFLLAVRLSCYYRRLLCPARLVRSVVCLSQIPSFHRWNDVDHFASSCWTLPLFSTVLWLFRFVQLFRFFIAFQQYIFSVQQHNFCKVFSFCLTEIHYTTHFLKNTFNISRHSFQNSRNYRISQNKLDSFIFLSFLGSPHETNLTATPTNSTESYGQRTREPPCLLRLDDTLVLEETMRSTSRTELE